MKTSKDKKRFPVAGHVVLGQRVVVHGHPYVLALQKVVEDSLGEAGVEQIRFVSYQTTLPWLKKMREGGLKGFELLEAANTLFCENGYGHLDASGLTKNGGDVRVVESHFAMGWYSRYGRRTKPVCHFICGFLQALMEVVYECDPNRCRIVEVSCFADQLEDCHFHIEVQP